MKAIVLAAGMGVRLDPHTANKPKTMASVGDRLIIDHVMDFVYSVADEACVVGGYSFNKLEEHLNINFPGTTLLYNPHFSEGSIRTLMTAFDEMDDDILLINSDHIYPKKMTTIIKVDPSHITAVCDFDRELCGDDMKITRSATGFLVKIRKELATFDGGYIGMTLIPKEMLTEYKKAATNTYKTCGKASHVEAILGEMAKGGARISIADASGIKWLEIDTPSELETARRYLKENKGSFYEKGEVAGGAHGDSGIHLPHICDRPQDDTK